MSEVVLGIDLGTTYSAMAYVDEQGVSRVIPNADGKTTTPSVVMLTGGDAIVGEIALNQWITNSESVVRWIKRAMGDSDYYFQGLTPVQLSAKILSALKNDAELFLGQRVEEAVITCPAYFASGEIENTKLAGEMAGFRVREIVKEPTAAAVYYGVGSIADGERTLVCDLGGGTYDACVLTRQNGAFVPSASAGSRETGGHDWTMELVEMAAERFVELCGDDPRNDVIAGQNLYEGCERAKRDFAKLERVSIACTIGGQLQQVEVARDEFEQRTEWLIQKLVAWSEVALTKASPPLGWADVDRILLVGGSSRLRRMATALAEVSGKQPEAVRDPDLAVALGAAMLAAGKVQAPRRPSAGSLESAPGLIEVNYHRTTTRALGTRVLLWEQAKPKITNALIIPHGTESPVSRSRDDFEVSSDQQEFIDVPVVEFESDEDFDVVGSFRFALPGDAKRGDPVAVSFQYDISGIVSVEARHAQSDQPLNVERHPYVEPDLDDIVKPRPRWVAFAIDTSGSMHGVKIEKAKRSLKDTARRVLETGRGQSRVSVVSFSSSAEAVCPPTDDMSLIEQAVDSLHAWGTTAMDEGVRQAGELLSAAPDGVARDLVMVTDGVPNDPDATLAVCSAVGRSGATLLNLGIGSEDVDAEFLGRLTPHSVVIDRMEDMSDALTSLLTQSAGSLPGGLTEAPQGVREAKR